MCVTHGEVSVWSLQIFQFLIQSLHMWNKWIPPKSEVCKVFLCPVIYSPKRNRFCGFLLKVGDPILHACVGGESPFPAHGGAVFSNYYQSFLQKPTHAFIYQMQRFLLVNKHSFECAQISVLITTII